jgi:hypothetical protein
VAILLGQGAVEVLGDVAGDILVELLLGRGQLHAQGAHMARRKEGPAVEIGHVLLEPPQKDGVLAPAHGPGQDVHVGKQVGVEQVEQQAKVLGIAFMRRGGQQQQVLGVVGQHLAQPVAAGALQLVAILVGDLPGATVAGGQCGPVDDVERLVELFLHFALPLGYQVGRGDDQGAGDGAPELELLEQ